MESTDLQIVPVSQYLNYAAMECDGVTNFLPVPNKNVFTLLHIDIKFGLIGQFQGSHSVPANKNIVKIFGTQPPLTWLFQQNNVRRAKNAIHWQAVMTWARFTTKFSGVAEEGSGRGKPKQRVII